MFTILDIQYFEPMVMRMCMHMCMCMRMRMRICVYAYMRICVCAYVYVYVYAYAYTDVYAYWIELVRREAKFRDPQMHRLHRQKLVTLVNITNNECWLAVSA